MTEPRILFLDIESTSLEADFGYMLAFGYKWLGGRTKVLSILTSQLPCGTCHRVEGDDRVLTGEVHKVMSAADMLVTWYGKGFDVPFINSRVIDAGLPPLPSTPHVDLYFTARHHLKLSSNRLASVQNFLQLKTEKTPLTRRVWRRAQAGDVPSIKYVVDHCRADVDVLEQAYEKLKPYVRQHPFVGSVKACRVCGGPVQKRGYALTALRGPRCRVQCTGCGAWETRAIEKVTARRAA